MRWRGNKFFIDKSVDDNENISARSDKEKEFHSDCINFAECSSDGDDDIQSDLIDGDCDYDTSDDSD